MTEQQIDNLLRKAPRATPPDGLLARLQADISLPQQSKASMVQPEPTPWLRRWLPALGFAGCFLACAVVFAVQTNTLSQLRKENETLRAAAQNIEQLRQDNVEYQRLLAENQELERLRKDALELQQLRQEVVQLRAQVQEMARLRAENQQLASGAHPVQKVETDEEFFARVGDPGDQAKRIRCVNNLKQIGLAARIWATDNNDVLPPNWLVMSNELSRPLILICPSDTARTPAANWSSFSAANVSYEFLNPNGSETEPEVVLTRCAIHNNVGLTDGSVHQLGKNRTITMKDGKYYMTDLSQDPFANYTELMRRRYGLTQNPGALPTNANPNVTNYPYYNRLMLERYGLIPVETNKPPSYE